LSLSRAQRTQTREGEKRHPRHHHPYSSRVKEFETPKRTFENDDTPKRKKTKTTTKKKKKKTRLLPPHAHRDEHWWCFCPSVHEPGMGAHNPNIFFFFFFFEGLCVKEVLFLCVSLSQKEKVKDFFITTFFNNTRRTKKGKTLWNHPSSRTTP